MSTNRELTGQTLLVIGGSSGIGYETARRARSEGANVILTARNADRLHEAGLSIGASLAAFDATEPDRLERFFDSMPRPIDHVLVSGPGPCGGKPGAFADEATSAAGDAAQRLLVRHVAEHAASTLRSGGALLFIGTTIRRRRRSTTQSSASDLGALTRILALELAPVRVNTIACGFVDTPLSAVAHGAELDAHRAHLQATLPIGRVVTASDVAALAVHLMTNEAITGATIDVDGGQQLVESQHGPADVVHQHQQTGRRHD